MNAFLVQFYADVRKWLGDPAHSKRLTNAQLLEDLYEAEAPIWEELMMAGGAESVIGRAEVPITIEDEVSEYDLPGSFRQFISLRRWGTEAQTLVTVTGGTYTDGTKKLEKTGELSEYCWRSGDKAVITAPSAIAGTYTIAGALADEDDNAVTLSTAAGDDASGTIAGTIQRTIPDKSAQYGKIMSIAENEPGPGVHIRDAERGMELRPKPILESDTIFTLAYQKGPIRLHYGEAAAVTADTVTLDATPTDGELIAQHGYYTGSLIRAYSATLGAPQTREIIAHDATWQRVQLARNWNPTPTGTVLYEICPALPPAYDKIYALDVAMKHAAPRRNPQLITMLRRLRLKLWNACLGYVLSNVMDRPPSRTPPTDPSKDDPYDFQTDDW